MGKFADVLKKAIFEESGEEPKKQPEEEEAKAPASSKVSITQNLQEPPTEPEAAEEGEIDAGILEKLEEKLAQEDIPGPDYLELKEAAMDEESVRDEPDERKRYRQAFSNMKRFFPQAGVTKARILQAIDHYEKVMEAEGKDAEEDLRRKIQSEVVAFREEIEKDEEELNRQQEALNKKRADLERRRGVVSEREKSLNAKSKNFLRTLNFLIGILKTDRKKLDEYLND